MTAQQEGRSHGFVALQGRGTLALPARLRKRLGLDVPGAQMEIVERADGVVELRPVVAVPAHEAWFWQREHQMGERDVDAHVAAGATTEHAELSGLIAHLDALDAE